MRACEKRWTHPSLLPGVIALAICCASTMDAVEPPDPLKDARIAHPLGTDRLLIQGGYISTAGQNEKMQEVPGFPNLFRTPPEWLAKFRIEPPTAWRSGDRWIVYTGAGSPVTVVIQELVLSPNSSSGWASAIARFENEDTASRIAGLRATDFIAVPGPGLRGVSQQALIPAENNAAFDMIEKSLLARGRALVGSKEWGRHSFDPSTAGLDRAFLEAPPLYDEVHLSRWSLKGRKPLLFVQIVWRGQKGEALFGANAVVEEGDVPSILDFDARPGEQMRTGDNEQANSWDYTWDHFQPVFMNAWVIGSRRFVLKYTQYYEGFGVELMELIPGRGLTPTGIAYGDGA